MMEDLTTEKSSGNRKIRYYYDLVYELGGRISEHKLFILAAGLAFNILLYIIPLVLILITFINIFLEPAELIRALEQVIDYYLPSTTEYANIIAGIISEVEAIANSSKIAGIIGFVILLWISSTVISTLNTCISHIFQVEQPHYIKTKLKDLLTTILLNILIVLYGVLLPMISFAESLISSFFPDVLGFWISKFTVLGVNLIVSAVFFYYIFWIVPSSKTRLTHWIAARATLIAVVLIEVARFLFTWYISTISNYSRFYGTYAVIVTMAIWLLYSCFIILFSAELSKFWWDKRKEKNDKLIAEMGTFMSPVQKIRRKQLQKKINKRKSKAKNK